MKYCGKIGFAETVETAPSVWEESIVERNYYGDVSRVIQKMQAGEGLNDNINFANSISIVADPFLRDNIQQIRYVTWLNSKWKISNVQVSYPRLILEIGGVYNGPEE